VILSSLALAELSPIHPTSNATNGETVTPSEINNLENLSFGELVQTKMPNELNKLLGLLQKVNKDTMPHETKNLRNQVGRVRDLLDLFSYAYPKTGDKDLFKIVRKDLDRGYETVGAFKDLYDTQTATHPSLTPATITYKPSELEKLRGKVLAWKEKFIVPNQLKEYTHYLNNPDRNELHGRDSKDLNKFYWGISRVKPSPDRPGLDSLRALIHDLLGLTEEDYGKVMKIEPLLESSDTEDSSRIKSFHDFRKHVRSILKVYEFFPELAPVTEKEKTSAAILGELVKRYGNLHDKIVACLKEKKDSPENSEGKRLKLNSEWNDLKKWQENQDLPALLDELKK
jgi:CHAD domain-containing protein